jgi:hypothetical protein
LDEIEEDMQVVKKNQSKSASAPAWFAVQLTEAAAPVRNRFQRCLENPQRTLHGRCFMESVECDNVPGTTGTNRPHHSRISPSG